MNSEHINLHHMKLDVKFVVFIMASPWGRGARKWQFVVFSQVCVCTKLNIIDVSDSQIRANILMATHRTTAWMLSTTCVMISMAHTSAIQDIFAGDSSTKELIPIPCPLEHCWFCKDSTNGFIEIVGWVHNEKANCEYIKKTINKGLLRSVDIRCIRESDKYIYGCSLSESDKLLISAYIMTTEELKSCERNYCKNVTCSDRDHKDYKVGKICQ